MTTAVEAHAHHWLIAPARGAVSPGRCQDCGTEREFRNFAEHPAFAPAGVAWCGECETRRNSYVHRYRCAAGGKA